MIRAVADTGPLLHLAEAGSLDLLQLIDDLYVPPQVITELVFHAADWQTPVWITVEPLKPDHAREAAAWQQAGLLDAGEAEAIALTRQAAADWLLTDDATARLFAQELGIEVHCSLGILLYAAAIGHLERGQAEQTLAQLASSSLWLSRRILAEARAALSEMYGDAS